MTFERNTGSAFGENLSAAHYAQHKGNTMGKTTAKKPAGKKMPFGTTKGAFGKEGKGAKGSKGGRPLGKNVRPPLDLFAPLHSPSRTTHLVVLVADPIDFHARAGLRPGAHEARRRGGFR